MKWLAVVLFSLLMVGGAAADQQLNVNIPGGGAQDLLNMTTVPSDVSDHSGDPSFQRFCTRPSGRIVRQGDPGYKDCLRLAQGKKPVVQPSAGPDHTIYIVH